MKTISRPLFLLSLPLLLALPARAAFSPEVVSAEARWVLYADLNALRSSVVGAELIEKAEELQAGALRDVVNVDMTKLLATIGTLTAYGSNLSPDPQLIDGTLVLQGTPDLAKIAESLLLQANVADPTKVTEIADLPFAAYGISAGEGEEGASAGVIVAFPPEPVVLISKSRSQLIAAHEVMRNPSQSLAQARSTPLAQLLGGTRNAFLFGASVVPSSTLFPENAPQARILQMASSAALGFGEDGPDTFAHAELKATSEDMAVKLEKILEGMTAMLSLAETDDENLSHFLNSARVAREGEIVTLDVAYPSARLLEMAANLGSDDAPAEPVRSLVPGLVVAQWTAASEASAASAETLAVRTIENVRIENGATLSIGGRGNGSSVRIDRLEIAPAGDAGMPLVFQAEHMRLQGFRPEDADFGQQGRLVQLRGDSGVASLVFPGVSGIYTLRLAYVNEPGSQADYEVGIATDEPAAAN